MFVQLFAPAGERWNCTDATPEPPSDGLALTVIVWRTAAPSAGAVSEPPGSVLSTRTVTAAVGAELPALSATTTRKSYWPSDSAVVSSETWYGALVTGVPIVVHELAPAGERWNVAEPT